MKPRLPFPDRRRRPRILRRGLTVGALLTAFAVAACGSDGGAAGSSPSAGSVSADGHTVTDVEGRQVELPDNIDRVILGKGRLLYTTAMLDHDNPLDKVVGWANDLKKSDAQTYDLYKKKFPALDDSVADLGALKKNNFNVEEALTLKPQVLLVEQEDFPNVKDTGLDRKLEAIGTKIVVVDFRLHPLQNTAPSVELMGKIFGKEDAAKDFADYYRDSLKTVSDAVTDADRSKTFLWRAAGLSDCCETFSDENLGEMVTFAGGDNIGDLLPGSDGQLSPEKIISEQPETVVATGGSWKASDVSENAGVVPFVELGYGADRKTVTDEVDKLHRQPGFDQLTAMKNKQVHAMWHQFYDSPYNFMAVEALAKWVHPDLFSDVDLDRKFTEFHDKFLPVHYQGVFFVDMDNAA